MKSNRFLISIIKISIIVLLFYIEWYEYVISPMPIVIWVCTFAMFTAMLIDSILYNVNLKRIFSFEVLCWATIIPYAIFAGFFVVDDILLVLEPLMRYIGFFIVMISVIYVCIITKNTTFFLKLYFWIAVIDVLTILYTGGYNTRLINPQLVVGEGQNPNSLGLVLFLGIVYAINVQKNSLYNKIFMYCTLPVFTYYLFLIGSRKSFIAIVLFLMISNLKFSLKKNIKLIGVGIGLLLLISSITIDWDKFILFQRFSDFFGGEGNETRLFMYLEAKRFFLENLVFGIGYDQFRNQSATGLYSHSNYAEVFSCLGTIGAMLYFVPILLLAKKMYAFSHNVKTAREGRLYLGLFITMLFLGTGIIHIYELNSFIIYGIMIAALILAKKELTGSDFDANSRGFSQISKKTEGIN